MGTTTSQSGLCSYNNIPKLQVLYLWKNVFQNNKTVFTQYTMYNNYVEPILTVHF